MQNKRAGFTLIELIVVIAIIGILAGITTSNYIKYVEKSKEGVCNAARQELMRILEAELATGNYSSVEQAYDAALKEYNKQELCPSKGDISLKINTDGSYEIVCSKHSHAVENLGSKDIINPIVEAMKAASSDLVDSGAGLVSNICETAKVQAKLKKEGINLDLLGAKAWSWSKSRSTLWWTPVDINTLNKGDKIPVMRYNALSGNYTVFWARIDTRKTSTSDKSYNVLIEAEAYAPSTVNDKGNQTYEQALKRYQEIAGH